MTFYEQSTFLAFIIALLVPTLLAVVGVAAWMLA